MTATWSCDARAQLCKHAGGLASQQLNRPYLIRLYDDCMTCSAKYQHTPNVQMLANTAATLHLHTQPAMRKMPQPAAAAHEDACGGGARAPARHRGRAGKLP